MKHFAQVMGLLFGSARAHTYSKSGQEGTPRRTIDFQHIYKYCERETHHTPRPFDAVSNIPPKSYKTVLDAYNGYHQVPLDEESSKLTTFITEF